jgi:hypothetical protein
MSEDTKKGAKSQGSPGQEADTRPPYEQPKLLALGQLLRTMGTGETSVACNTGSGALSACNPGSVTSGACSTGTYAGGQCTVGTLGSQ